MPYAYKFEAEKKYAKAQLHDLPVSYKDLTQVCGNVRFKPTTGAMDLLEKVVNGDAAIRYKKFNKGLGHRSELGGLKGGYPVKAVKMVLQLVKNAHANAEKLGLGETKIVHICANKQNSYPRMSPKGRPIRQAYETARVDIVLAEIGVSQEKKGKGKKAPEQQKSKEIKVPTEAQKIAKKQEKQLHSKQAIPA